MKAKSFIRQFLLPLLSFILPVFSRASDQISFGTEINAVYKSILELRLQDAQGKINILKDSDPDNLTLDFLEDYVDFFTVYISEEKELFKLLNSRALQRTSRLEKSELSSPYLRYMQAEILLHWGLIHIKFGNYFTAFSKIKTAHKLLKENYNLYPQFVPSLKGLAMLHAITSTIPSEIRWIVKLVAGMSGTIGQAKFEMEQVLLYGKKNEYLFDDEAKVLYSLLLTYFDNDPHSGWQWLSHINLDHKQSPLIQYVEANLAFKAGDNDKCIELLSAIPKSASTYPFFVVDFLLGKAKLRRLDQDANQYLTSYVHHFKGIHFIKECYQKLAWYSLINGNLAGYYQYMELVKTKGNLVTDEDKQAMHEALNNKPPDLELLQSRLLFDGHYLEKAEQLLLSKKENILSKPNLALEYYYRLGRIQQNQNRLDQAISNYQRAIAGGKNSSEYQLCASYLYLGEVYEKKNDSKSAIYFYQKCIDTNPKDYGNGLHQKAKSGLSRIDP